MQFNKHLEIPDDEHAFLSPSKWHWLNYTTEKLTDVYLKYLSVQRGTDLHELAKRCIELNTPLREDGSTLSMYVNDAIDFKMTPEQKLVYSKICHGTADTISFRRKKLRIHDLKTGVIPAHMEQLKIYAALFCLEYKVKPKDISIELRIYQSNDVLVCNPEAEEIEKIMEKIVSSDKVIEKINSDMEK